MEQSLIKRNATERGEMYRNGVQCCEMDWNHVYRDAVECSSSVLKGMKLYFTEWNAMERGGMLWNGVEFGEWTGMAFDMMQ